MSRALRRVMLGLAVLGMALAIYLVYLHYSGARPICTSKGGDTCFSVQHSVWSKVDAITLKNIGLIGYVAILGSLALPDRDATRILTVGMTIIGVGFSGYLTYRELFSLHEICEECVTSAVIMTLLFIGAVWRFIITDDLLTPARVDLDTPDAPEQPLRSRSRTAV